MRVKALERAIEQLTSAYANNLREFKNAFMMTDQHLFVIQRVQNDLSMGRVRYDPVHPEDGEFLASDPPWQEEQRHTWKQTCPKNVKGEVTGLPTINLGWYHWQYYQMRQFEGLVGWMRNALGLNEKPVEEPEENVEYFGGDAG